MSPGISTTVLSPSLSALSNATTVTSVISNVVTSPLKQNETSVPLLTTVFISPLESDTSYREIRKHSLKSVHWTLKQVLLIQLKVTSGLEGGSAENNRTINHSKCAHHLVNVYKKPTKF